MAEYGETIQDIENNIPDGMYGDFLMAGGREMLEQVRIENMQQRINSPAPQTPIPTTAKTDPNYTASNKVSMAEKEILDNHDFAEKRQMLFSKAKSHLASKTGEDSVDNIYLDTKGYITIGAGKKVDDKKTFMALNLKNGNREATYAEKLEAYNKFQELKTQKEYGQTYDANHYKRYSPLRITNQTIDDLLTTHLLNDINKLGQGMPEFNSLPLELQEVLVDIRYNTGAITEELWPNLRKAIREKNLSAIAKEVHRKDISEERNKWILDKLKSIKDWGYWKD